MVGHARRVHDELQRRRGLLLRGVVVFVVVAVVVDLVALGFLLLDRAEEWRLLQAPLHLLSAAADVLLLVLAWMLLRALARIERESERTQEFMDNVYRRLPP